MDIVSIIQYLSNFSIIIPILLILRLGSKLFSNKAIRILTLLLLISGFTDMCTYFIGLKQQNTALFSNLYTLIEFILLGLLYTELLYKHKMLVNCLIGIFIIFFLVDSFLIEIPSEFQSYTLTLEGMIMLFFSSFYFVEHVKRINTRIPISHEISSKNLEESRKLYDSIFNSKNDSNLWINSAIFFYFVMDIYLFSIAKYVFTTQSTAIAMSFWSFHNFCNLVKNLLFAFGIYYARENRVRSAN